MHQLEAFGRATPGRAIAVRMNPGLGSGSVKRTNTGGPSASFGIWHDYAAEVKTVAARYGLTIGTLHTHIGSGTDPEVWKRATRMTLDLVAQFPDVAAVKLPAYGSRGSHRGGYAGSPRRRSLDSWTPAGSPETRSYGQRW
ncbi:MAG: hypothetical protein DME00_35835 [Candidatus Rokuibacteriota bacterium]|nr:MAG: hypothetical protein DME00_35835 [Candidatus Rokubacteria bacterium]